MHNSFLQGLLKCVEQGGARLKLVAGMEGMGALSKFTVSYIVTSTHTPFVTYT